MPLLRIYRQPSFRQVFIASEAISDLATIEISTVGQGYVQQARDSNPERAVGVARGSVNSGGIVHAVVQGIISGVIAAATVNAGDRLMIASGGMVTPLNTITAAGLFSGIAGGLVSGIQAASGIISGYATVNLSGYATMAAFNTTRVVGKALTSGGAGSGIAMLVAMAG
jgi:hypothetical protein